MSYSISTNSRLPVVASFPDGTFAIAWQDNQWTTGQDPIYYLQRYDASMTKIGSLVTLSTDYYSCSYVMVGTPALLVLKNGNLAVAKTNGGEGAWLWVLDRDDLEQKIVTPLNFYTTPITAVTNQVANPAFALLPNGNFVMTWAMLQSQSEIDIVARVFDPTGNAVTSEIAVNTYTSGSQTLPSVGTFSDGSFVIVYQSIGNPGGNSADIYFQRFDSSYSKVGSETRVNTYITGAQISSIQLNLIQNGSCMNYRGQGVIVLDNNNFVVTWQGGTGSSISAQIFDSTGNLVGTEITVSSTGSGTNAGPSIVKLANGNFVISWINSLKNQINGRLYDSSGSPLGDQFAVSAQSAAFSSPTVASLSTNDYLPGGFIITWSGTGNLVYTQLYDSDGDPISVIMGTSADDDLTGTAAKEVISGLDGDDILEGKGGADALNGGLGIDTASYDSSTAGVTVNLSTGKGSGGDAEGDRLVSIENLVGSAFADTLTGDENDNSIQGGAGDDTLEGKSGADSLDGGAGTDTATYASSTAGVTVNLLTGTGVGGDAEGDTLSSIENLIGSASADTLIGDADDNILQGGAGADALNGGAGVDTASYQSSAAGVTVNLSTGRGTGGDAEGDTLVAIENLIGSAFADTLIGDSNNNNIQGGAGDDTLEGKGGEDMLTGGQGNDIFKISQESSGTNIVTITDFTVSSDKINLQSFSAATDFSQFSFTEDGGDTTLELDSYNKIVFLGVSSSTLSASDFTLNTIVIEPIPPPSTPTPVSTLNSKKGLTSKIIFFY